MSVDPNELAERLGKLALAHLSDEQMEKYTRAMIIGAYLRVTSGKDGEIISVEVIPSSDIYLQP